VIRQLDGASAGPCTLRIMVFAWVAVWAVECSSGEPSRQEPVSWRQLPSLPDPLGVAGAFCGLIDGQLVVAGGANFPDGAPWEGGTKQWHSAIYCLDHPEGTWRTIGNLPHGLGYGVAISVADGLLCVGGSDADRHHADVLLIRLAGGQAEVSRLAPLPIPLALMAGALVDNVVYLGGGAEEPGEQAASRRVFCLRLDKLTGHLLENRQWEELPSLPGEPRLLPGAAALNGAFYLFGGVAVVTEDGIHRRSYLRDGLRWDPRERSWRKIADCPQSLAAGPSPGPAIGPNHFLVLGGDDGSRLGFQPVAQHPGFPGQLWAYHSVTDTWTQFGTSPAPRVTTGLVKWNDQFVIPSGEVRPGVRSPEVWAGRIEAGKPRFGWVNYSVLAGYLLLVTAVGLLASGHLTTTRQFFRADQSIPWWAAGLSIFATMLSSITFMSIPAQGYSVGWNLFLGSVYVVLTPLIVAFYLPFFRRLDVTSAYEYLELRFSVAVRMLASSQFMLFQLGRVAVVLFLPSLALSTVAGIDITISIVSVGLLCVVYTMFGGMRAVIWTDAVQTAVLMGGALWALATLIRRIPGGVSEIVAVADQQQRFFGSLDWSWDYTLATGWIIMLGSLFSNLFSFTASQDVVQRYLTTADERTAARALWTNSLLAPPAHRQCSSRLERVCSSFIGRTPTAWTLDWPTTASSRTSSSRNFPPVWPA
jgi:solute:Na+ symporter, SSS family